MGCAITSIRAYCVQCQEVLSGAVHSKTTSVTARRALFYFKGWGSLSQESSHQQTRKHLQTFLLSFNLNIQFFSYHKPHYFSFCTDKHNTVQFLWTGCIENIRFSSSGCFCLLLLWLSVFIYIFKERWIRPFLTETLHRHNAYSVLTQSNVIFN